MNWFVQKLLGPTINHVGDVVVDEEKAVLIAKIEAERVQIKTAVDAKIADDASPLIAELTPLLGGDMAKADVAAATLAVQTWFNREVDAVAPAAEAAVTDLARKIEGELANVTGQTAPA